MEIMNLSLLETRQRMGIILKQPDQITFLGFLPLSFWATYDFEGKVVSDLVTHIVSDYDKFELLLSTLPDNLLLSLSNKLLLEKLNARDKSKKLMVILSQKFFSDEKVLKSFLIYITDKTNNDFILIVGNEENQKLAEKVTS